MTHDPLKDPRPGYVVQIRPGWTRTVLTRLNDWVEYRAKYYDVSNDVDDVSLESWQEACKAAKVLHVAD